RRPREAAPQPGLRRHPGARGARWRRHVPRPGGALHHRRAGERDDAPPARARGRRARLRGLGMKRAARTEPAGARTLRAGATWPARGDLRTLAREGNLIPVCREILADLETPVSAFLKIHRGPYGFLLESVEGGEKWGRYSFLGTEPARVFRSRGRTVEIETPGRTPERQTVDDPFEALRRLLAAYRPVPVPGLPRFAGGAADRARAARRRAGRGALELHPGRLREDRRARQGVHPRRRHHPGRGGAALRAAARRRALRRLPLSPHREPVTLHVLPGARRPR